MQKAQGDVKGTATKNTGSFFDKFIKGERFKKKDREKKYTDSKASVFGKKPAMLGDKGSPIPANLGDRGKEDRQNFNITQTHTKRHHKLN